MLPTISLIYVSDFKVGGFLKFFYNLCRVIGAAIIYNHPLKIFIVLLIQRGIQSLYTPPRL